MKKLINIGIIILISGLVIFGITFLCSGFDFQKFCTTTQWQQKTVDIENKNQDINLIDKDSNVQIDTSQDEQIHIIYSTRENETYDIDNSDSINIESVNNDNWKTPTVDFYKTPTTQILLPKTYNGSLTVENDNMNIQVNSINAKSVKISTSNGKIDVNNVNCENKIDLYNNSGSYINLCNSNASDINCQTSNTNIKLDNIKCSGSLLANTDSADISISNISIGNETVLSTKNGDIYGNINDSMKNFTIQSEAKHGDNNLPSHIELGNKTLSATTDHGDINIEFNQK